MTADRNDSDDSMPAKKNHKPALDQEGPKHAPRDIKPPGLEPLKWETPDDREISLQALYQYAEENANVAITWYLKHKNSKSTWSRILRLSAIILATLGGLAPVIEAVSESLITDLKDNATLESRIFNILGIAADLIGELGYLWLALAAACVATDKLFGFSSGWMRYMNTAQILMKELAEFRLDWAMLMANRWETPADAESSATMAQTQFMIQRIKAFVMAVNAHAEQETLTWIAEFQTSLSEIERTVKTQEASSKPGAIEVTVINGMEAEGGFQIALNGLVMAKDINETKYLIGYVPPGHHKVSVTGFIAGNKLEASTLVEVLPGTITKVPLTLPAVPEQT